MFWNKISPVYDLFENVYNRKVYKGTGIKVAEFIDESDNVLECACGTGAITEEIAKKAQKVLATDFAEGMLKRASRKCRKYGNVSSSLTPQSTRRSRTDTGPSSERRKE